MAEFPRLVQTVIDATDVRRTAEFYRELFGLEYRPGDELQPTTWPEPEVPMQLHLDCSVPDLDELRRQRARAEALGAMLRFDRSDDPDEPLFVMVDPEGHPFCLFVSA